MWCIWLKLLGRWYAGHSPAALRGKFTHEHMRMHSCAWRVSQRAWRGLLGLRVGVPERWQEPFALLTCTLTKVPSCHLKVISFRLTTTHSRRSSSLAGRFRAALDRCESAAGSPRTCDRTSRVWEVDLKRV